MANAWKILIVGAGPVGLTAALELARRGIVSRIIDDNEPSPVNESRALAVNKRTFDLLAPSGVSALLRAEAIQVREMRIYSGSRHLTSIDLQSDGAADGVLNALPQGRTERLLAARLAEFRIEPEWGVKFAGLCDDAGGKIIARLEGPSGNEEYVADILIGADGAHSLVRKSIGLEFTGESFPETFYIADVTYDRDLDVDYGEARFFNPGVVARIPVSRRTFRFISTLENFKSLIVHPAKIVEMPWESTFRAVFRHVEPMQKGKVFLVGDAAHIHSPIGGRGMNLGIEDACWLAWLISDGREAEYSALRKDAVEHVLAQTKAATQGVLLKNPVAVWLRNLILPLALKFPTFRRIVLKGVRGLDTPAPPWLEQDK